MSILVAFLGGAAVAFGAVSLYVVGLFKQKKAQLALAAAPAESDSDAMIRKALAEGLLTDAELVEIGIDPEEYRAIQKIEKPETKATLIEQFARMTRMSGINMADISERFTHLQDIEIRTPGAYVSVSSMSVRGNGNIVVRDGSVNISVGGGDPEAPIPFDMPMMPVIPPIPPIPPMPPMPPMNRMLTGADDRAMDRHQRALDRRERQIEKQLRQHERALDRHERAVERAQRRRR